MHGRIWLAGVAVVLTAGCATEAGPVAVPAVEPVTVEVAAASSGGACRLLDFAVIAKHTGARFDVAAASERGDTHTCVVRAERSVLPELTLTVTETSIDVSTFTADVLPDGATKVTKLGRIAYRRTLPKTAKLGPAAEVAWLATDGRLATLRWTCPRGADEATAEEVAGKLVSLAKLVDTRRI
ncbi:hypothetical protein GA0070624_2442 [Micromonospora rhizosphaerae]|uniref:DUF3558 domain-containing protein n=1 Tax=Micromonospora rhizosphaerae TaxID=568872 RepID=A0A1C6RXP7_9ACTN|nr:hypothetical protein [Micromonospora rhizosphaerae]SCL22005.1 hypothetical protein GA0070624_2442 [Micromonospora rhizosphaerae]